jgi:hypothetical protein
MFLYKCSSTISSGSLSTSYVLFPLCVCDESAVILQLRDDDVPDTVTDTSG